MFGSYVNILFEPLERERNVTPAETNRLLNVQEESRCSLWEGPRLGNTLYEQTAYLPDVGADDARLSLCFKRLIKRIVLANIVINAFATHHTYL